MGESFKVTNKRPTFWCWGEDVISDRALSVEITRGVYKGSDRAFCRVAPDGETLDDRSGVCLRLKIRVWMLKAEVMETLLRNARVRRVEDE